MKFFNMKKKILAIFASSNRSGNSSQIAEWFIQEIPSSSYEVERVYLYDLDIPFFTNENRDARVEYDPADADVRALIDSIESCDKIIIATPIWNFGVPAILKSFLDRALCSGRIWSNAKSKKVAAWGGKDFYLFITMGGRWYSLLFNRYGIGQLSRTLWYYGARSHLVQIVFGCGNGSKCVVENRKKIMSSLKRKARGYFR